MYHWESFEDSIAKEGEAYPQCHKLFWRMITKYDKNMLPRADGRNIERYVRHWRWSHFKINWKIKNLKTKNIKFYKIFEKNKWLQG